MLSFMALSITDAKGRFRIGIRIPTWANYVRGIYPGLLAYIQQGASWRVETSEDSTREIPPTPIDKHWQGDGLIVFRCNRQELAAWTRRDIRIVNISSESPTQFSQGVATVVPDNRAIGRLAAQHLLSRGLRSFAFWHDPTRQYSIDRLGGFTELIEQAGFDVRVLGMPVSETPFKQRWRTIEALLQQRLVELPAGTGLFAKDDISAAAIVRVCEQVGCAVPGHIAVIGCNDDPAFAYTSAPSLTSVAYPGEAIGRAAAAVLDRMLLHPTWRPEAPTRVTANTLVERESTATFAFEDELASEVWTWINSHSRGLPLRVSTLARALSVAEPTLRRRFKRATGQSVKAAIDQHRLKLIEQALRHKNETLSSIAYNFGFDAPEEFSRFVKRCSGTSPQKLRAHLRENL